MEEPVYTPITFIIVQWLLVMQVEKFSRHLLQVGKGDRKLVVPKHSDERLFCILCIFLMECWEGWQASHGAHWHSYSEPSASLGAVKRVPIEYCGYVQGRSVILAMSGGSLGVGNFALILGVLKIQMPSTDHL